MVVSLLLLLVNSVSGSHNYPNCFMRFFGRNCNNQRRQKFSVYSALFRTFFSFFVYGRKWNGRRCERCALRDGLNNFSAKFFIAFRDYFLAGHDGALWQSQEELQDDCENALVLEL